MFDIARMLHDAVVVLDNRKRLAAAIDVSYGCLSHWFTGRAEPNVYHVVRILDAAGLDFADYIRKPLT